MPKSKKPRKGYKRVVILTKSAPLPITLGLSDEQKKALRLPYHLALDALKRGAGSDDEAHLIFTTLLVGREIAKLYQQEARDTILLGIAAITGVKERGDATGKWGMSGDQFRAISEALVLTDDLQDKSTRREVRDALVTVYDLIGDVKVDLKEAA